MRKTNFAEQVRTIQDEEEKLAAFVALYSKTTGIIQLGLPGSDFYPNGKDDEFSEQDLQFLKDNFEKYEPAYNLDIRRTGFYRTDKAFTFIGILPSAVNYGLANKEVSDLFVEVFLKFFIEYGDGPGFALSEEDIKGLTSFITTNESKFFKLFEFEKFTPQKFNEFLVQQFNSYLDLEAKEIQGLEFGSLNTNNKLRFGSRGGLQWVPRDYGAFGDFIQGQYESYIDPSLFKKSTNFKTPFDTLSGDEYSTNRIRLEGAWGNLGINGLESDANAWYDYEKYDSNAYYIKNFFLKFLTEVINPDLSYDPNRAGFLFKAAANQFLSNNQVEWSIDGSDFKNDLKYYLAKKILDDLRYGAWQFYHKELKDSPDSEKLDKDELAKKAFNQGEQAAKEGEPFQVDPNAKKDEDLTEADIKDKQKFLKQCVLMTQLEKLRQEHLLSINNPLTSVHFKGGSFLPYRGRFYMVKESTPDQSSTINKLLIPNEQSISQFLNISPAVAAHLVPKLRFYKVFTTDDGKLDEFEFEFRNFTDSNRANNLMNTNFDRGGDYGIKSFDFSFDGTTPATAKNDIKADLKLYFQSFEDFLKKRRFGDYEHSFVDLLLLPGGQPKNGSGKESDFQYNPSYYRIRVDVGWMIDPVQMPSVKANIGNQGAQDLAKALELINKSFYLNMIDHTMDFRDDGSVDISVNYRAYVESALKGTSLDALADKRTQESLNAARQDYEEIVSKNICSIQELNQIRRSLSQLQELLKKQSLQSIMQRLIERLMIRTKKADKAAVDVFAKTGFLDKRVELTDADIANTDDDYLYINYFYMADLLYVILDSIYDETGENYIQGTENFKFVLTSFEYTDIFSNTGAPPPINIGSIPITTDIFAEWFKENVLKPERTNYPIMYFIRDLCKFLLVEIMSETCFKSTFDRSLNFKTANFLGKRNASGVDAMASLYPTFSPTAPNFNDLVIDVTRNYSLGNLPLRAEGASVFDLHNYIVIYAETPMHTTSGKVGDPVEDGKNGIIHYRIGQDKGIVKKIKFSKSDMQYIREARFFRHGNDGLMQLSAVYKVSLDMIGNTLYYPGMEVFIDPVGFLGANQDADPRIINSVANKLGFGGYHLVTSVKSSIAPGKFTTTVDALFHYSGDGQPSSVLIGKGKDAKKASEIKKIDEKTESKSFSEECNSVYGSVITELNQIANNRKTQYERIDLRSQAEKQKALDQALTNVQTAVTQKKSALEDLAADKLRGVQESLKDQGDALLQKAKGSALYKSLFGE